jgi:23S rRNA pseudouridine2605 synthase
MRLNKFIAHYTTYSRREADRAIQDGYVRIDNEVELNPATQVDEYAHGITISGKKIIPSDKYTVIVYNKAKGELVTKKDPRGRRTIYDTLERKYRHFIPVGRLDYASEGVLLLTDASRIANALMNSDLQRLYRIKIRGEVTQEMETAMQKGMILDDATAGAHELSEISSMEFAPFHSYSIIKNRPDYSILKVSITEGKNRELRRFFAHFGAEVADLKRLSYGGVELNNLPTGKSRFLSRSEYSDLRRFLKEDRLREKQR